jgi:dihydrolipoamide dehydrogenase
MPSTTQLAVIGAGPGGYAAAFYAAVRGLQATLIDPEPNPGGVCLYRGCIPSKALLHAAKLVTDARQASALGLTFDTPRIDLEKLRSWKGSVVERLTGGLGQGAKQRGVAHLQGTASFLDATTLSVRTASGDERLRFEHAIIATGSQPARPRALSIDSPRVLDSTSALELPDIPKALLVVGGGYIGLELGTVYAALGSEVSIVEMTPGLLPGADRDLIGVLARRMEQVASRIMLSARVVRMQEDGAGVRVWLEGEGVEPEQVFDRVLVAVGRRPNSAIPGLEKTGVKVGDRGFIEVGSDRQTAEPSIYAIGDVVGEPMLAHKASHEAVVAVDAILGERVAFEPQAIPAVVFTDPELAWCGLTETDAKRQGREVAVARFPWGASGRAITLDRTDGATKLVIDPKTERILGAGIVGPGAGELIAEAVVAIEMGATVADLKLSIHPHPTLSETLMEAADVFFGESAHFYKAKRKTS